MALNYLDFEYSEDTEGVGTFDAMASVGAMQLFATHFAFDFNWVERYRMRDLK